MYTSIYYIIYSKTKKKKYKINKQKDNKNKTNPGVLFKLHINMTRFDLINHQVIEKKSRKN